MRRCRSCTAPVSFGLGLIAAVILPPKVACAIAALLLIYTCLKLRR